MEGSWPHKLFHENGQLAEEGRYVTFIKKEYEGVPIKDIDPNIPIRTSGKSGEVKRYDVKGKLIEEILYYKGEIVNELSESEIEAQKKYEQDIKEVNESLGITTEEEVSKEPSVESVSIEEEKSDKIDDKWNDPSFKSDWFDPDNPEYANSQHPDYPSWEKYYRGKVKEKLQNDIIKVLDERREHIIKLKKENDWDDLDVTEIFLQNMDINDLLDKVLDSGTTKLSNGDDESMALEQTWNEEEEAWIELEGDANSVIYNYWKDL